MKNASAYIRTDLACESDLYPKTKKAPADSSHYSLREYRKGGCQIAELHVRDEAGAVEIGREPGKYITFFCGKTWLMDNAKKKRISRAIGSELRTLSLNAAGIPAGTEVSKNFKVLVAGLGNRFITADAIGPLTADKLPVTRHIQKMEHILFDALGYCELSVIKPGVLGQTGIEAADLLRFAAECVKPDVILAIDALASKSCDRLATTIQMSDSGISPGSGIGNTRNALRQNTVGVPVIALGLPTVVDSSSLVYGVLRDAGYGEEHLDPALKTLLDNGRNFFVSPKEIDVIVEDTAALLASSIEYAYAASGR